MRVAEDVAIVMRSKNVNSFGERNKACGWIPSRFVLSVEIQATNEPRSLFTVREENLGTEKLIIDDVYKVIVV